VGVRVSDIACGRAGDKGAVLDLTLVAADGAGYERLAAAVTAERAEAALALGPVRRYEVPGLRALKFVAPEALGGGLFATLHAGMHWQKAAIGVLLDLELADGGACEAGAPGHH
jgi:hypothetical protein